MKIEEKLLNKELIIFMMLMNFFSGNRDLMLVSMYEGESGIRTSDLLCNWKICFEIL